MSIVSWQVRALWPAFPQVPQRRTVEFPSLRLLSLECLSRQICTSISSCARISCSFSTISTPPWQIRSFLAFWRLKSASFAARRVRTSAARRVFSWASRSVPFANAVTVAKSGVCGLPWWQAIRFRTRVVYERASVGLEGVWEIQGLLLAEEGLEGIGVCNFISSFEITTCGSKGTKPAPQNPAWAFWAVIDSLYAAVKARKISTFVILLI